jgi:hypothetical protein
MCTSDEIALPSQVQCEMCKAAPTHICLHRNICGAAAVQRRREELAALEPIPLVMTIIQVCKDTVPIEYWDDTKKIPWEHLYENMHLHLVPVGRPLDSGARLVQCQQKNKCHNLFNKAFMHVQNAWHCILST